jgi:predicted Zn-ribbon and HTH transcriptional regulator
MDDRAERTGKEGERLGAFGPLKELEEDIASDNAGLVRELARLASQVVAESVRLCSVLPIGKLTGMKLRLTTLKCQRCGHEWIPRQAEVRICPKCKSAKWDVPKPRGAVSEG